MGARKRLAAEKRKAANKTQYFAKLKGVPSHGGKSRSWRSEILKETCCS